MAELKRIVSKWHHNRDRAVYRYPNGFEEVLYDSGCKACHRCEVEAWIAKQERQLPENVLNG